ncbi:MAG TPA: hypothetical protein VMH38_06885 [Thermoplasmata archaeon]|nr:hypothetical protein [Thermoplasmata archaeon]
MAHEARARGVDVEPWLFVVRRDFGSWPPVRSAPPGLSRSRDPFPGPLGEGATVKVSASAHHRHGPNDDDAEELGAMVRHFLEREVARFHREYVGSILEDPGADPGASA